MNDEGPGYLGKILEEERRLVLVPLDPERPWAAFRKMRALMKRNARAGRVTRRTPVGSPLLSSSAEVIPLRRKDAELPRP